MRAAANPYDPKWEHYFEKRLQAKMADRRVASRINVTEMDSLTHR